MKITITYKVPGGSLHRAHETENNDYSLKIVEEGERTSVSILPKRPIVLKKAKIILPCDFSGCSSFFVNGYQSWTATKEYLPEEEMHSLDRVPGPVRDRFHFGSYGDYWFRPYKKGELHSFTYAYTRSKEDECDLIGSLNENRSYLVITYQKNRNRICLESDCKGRSIEEEFVLFDYVRYQGSMAEVQERYFSLYGDCEAKPIRGYTSWYLDYQDINEEKMQKTLDSVDPEQFDLFQIDDGYESFVGDWLDADPIKFPQGLQGMVEKIHAKGLLAGIWLAPFVCEKKSRICTEHPEWVYQDSSFVPVSAGSNWSGFMPLDIRRADVRQYIKGCLEYYMDAGFDFFKLDFLYAAAMIKSSLFTKAEIMWSGMRFLREILRDKLILGCGVPLSSAFGNVDYCRIGPDISLDFDDKPFMRLMHNERVSTKNTLLNTIYRHPMDGHVFRCDPDVFLLRDNDIGLSKEMREAVVMIDHLCGSVYMTSDDPGDYDEEKKEVLARARKLCRCKVTNVKREANLITIEYLDDQEQRTLVYDSAQGVLLNESL